MHENRTVPRELPIEKPACVQRFSYRKNISGLASTNGNITRSESLQFVLLLGWSLQ
jgi:hypothetical protein